ncbi:AMED_5909 family protein [Amycolatopsis orientalis]|uniref:AMED_5909 family protein n=1 Tax=Amycolatopsis orientalis TaxID=31958 RepID=UPI000A5B7C60
MKVVGEQRPQTLRDAHAAAAARRPQAEAGMSEWLRFHQANARMYREVSDVDRDTTTNSGTGWVTRSVRPRR